MRVTITCDDMPVLHAHDPKRGPFADITAPEHEVQVIIDAVGHRLWVNVDGVCMLRACRIPAIRIDDDRQAIAEAREHDSVRDSKD